MLVLGVVTWGDMARNHAAWTTIVLLATLVTLADGLSRAGFVKWFADYAAAHVGGLPPMLILMSLVAIYFVSHYMFASLTAHTTAMMPMMLAAGLAIPGPVGDGPGDGPGAVHRPDRRADAVCHRRGAAVLQLRLPDAGAILAARSDFRR